MPEYVTTLTSYNPQQINRDDGSNFTLHKFHDVAGTEMVARADVANIARGFINVPALVTVRTEQKGRWINHYLDHIRAADGAQPAIQAQQAQQTYQQQAGPEPSTTAGPAVYPTTQTTGTSATEWHQELTEKDKQIHRQVAAKVAAGISSTSNEFWRNCADLAHYFDTGRFPEPPQDDIPF